MHSQTCVKVIWLFISLPQHFQILLQRVQMYPIFRKMKSSLAFPHKIDKILSTREKCQISTHFTKLTSVVNSNGWKSGSWRKTKPNSRKPDTHTHNFGRGEGVHNFAASQTNRHTHHRHCPSHSTPCKCCIIKTNL